MKKIIIGFLCIATLIWSSCTETAEGFLDSKGNEPDTEAIFADSALTIQFHVALYMQLGRVAQAPNTSPYMIADFKDLELATDNGRHVWWTKSEFTQAFTQGDFTQNGINANNVHFEKTWEEMYQSIQRCNTFLVNYEKAPLSDAKKASMLSETRFLRAFYYYHLLRCYGGIPLVGDVPLDPFDPPALSRSTFEEVVDYLAKEFEGSVNDLPEVQKGAEYGRPTKGAALAMLGKLYILAASPLHNGGNVGSGVNRAFVGYEDYKIERWNKVVDALERMMALGTHKLEVDNTTRPGNGFYRATTQRLSDERIWYWLTNNKQGFPGSKLLPPSRQGTARAQPYHGLTEAFPMKNGLPIDDDNSGYDSSEPYNNRDPRFDYTIIHNQSKWIRIENGNPEEIYTYEKAELDGIYLGNASTQTGYYYRKGCAEEHLGNKNLEGQGINFVRYADIMLMYAEALTEIDVDANRAKIEEQLIAIRDRAGIEKGSDSRYGIPANMDKDDMISFIIAERRIEFANEAGNRFYDLLRRKLFEKLDNKWSSVAVWQKAGDEYAYSIQQSVRHSFDSPRMYHFAIPLKEIRASNMALIQNPGW